MEGDNLVTVSVGPDNNKVVRKYEITQDGVVLVRFVYVLKYICKYIAMQAFTEPTNLLKTQNFFHHETQLKEIEILYN